MSITEQGSPPEHEKSSSANEKMEQPSQVNHNSTPQQQRKREAWKKKFQNTGIDSSTHSNPPRLPGRTRTRTDIKFLVDSRSNSNSSCSSADDEEQPRVNDDDVVGGGTPQESNVEGGVSSSLPIQSFNQNNRKTQAPRPPGRKVTPRVTVRRAVGVRHIAPQVSLENDDDDDDDAQVPHEDENDNAIPPVGERRNSEPPKMPGRKPSKSNNPSNTMEKVYEDFRDKFARRFSVPKMLSNGVRLSQAPQIPGRRPSQKRRPSHTETLDEGTEQDLSETNQDGAVTSKWMEEYDDSSIGTLDGDFDEEDPQQNSQSSLIRQWVANLEENPSDGEDEEDDEEEVVLFDLDKSVEENFNNSNSSFHLYVRRDSFESNISGLSMGTTKFESEITDAAGVASAPSGRRKFSNRVGQKRFSNSMRGSGEKRVGKPSMPRRQQSTGNTFLSEASSTKDTSTSGKDSKEEEDIIAAPPTTASLECPEIPLPPIPIRQASVGCSGGTLVPAADQVEKLQVACTE